MLLCGAQLTLEWMTVSLVQRPVLEINLSHQSQLSVVIPLCIGLVQMSTGNGLSSVITRQQNGKFCMVVNPQLPRLLVYYCSDKVVAVYIAGHLPTDGLKPTSSQKPVCECMCYKRV